MNIVLILPRDPACFYGWVSKSGKAGIARLTLSTLAALTPKKHNVRIIDSRVTKIDYDIDVDLVGITALTSEVPSAYEFADGFRKRGIPVVMGGAHVSALPDEALEHADAVVIGEAENVWAQLLEDCEKKQLKKKYKSDALCDITKIAVPRRELLDRSMYTSFNTIQATRGCPFDCNYCMVTKFFGNSYRTRPVEDIVNEVKRMDDKNIIFLDDNIVGNPKYAKELFKALIPLNIRWGSQGSITIAKDQELLDLYAKSGGKTIFIGFESITQEGLKSMNKSWGKSDGYEEAIRKIHKAGISIIGSFIFGLDGDDIGVFDRTFDFVMKNNLENVMYNILTPFPGTELYSDIDNQGRITNKDWSKYNTCWTVINPKNMTKEELEDGYKKVFLKTYTIKNILRRVVRPSNKNIFMDLVLNYSYYRKIKRFFVKKEYEEPKIMK